MPPKKKKSGRKRKVDSDEEEAPTQDFFHPSEDKAINPA